MQLLEQFFPDKPRVTHQARPLPLPPQSTGALRPETIALKSMEVLKTKLSNLLVALQQEIAVPDPDALTIPH